MKVTLNWLKDYVDFDFDADDLSHRLTMTGLEVDAMERLGDILDMEPEQKPEDMANRVALPDLLGRQPLKIIDPVRFGLGMVVLQLRNLCLPYRDDQLADPAMGDLVLFTKAIQGFFTGHTQPRLE